jgi:hypothetical protein
MRQKLTRSRELSTNLEGTAASTLVWYALILVVEVK